MLGHDPEANARLFEQWAHHYVEDAAAVWQELGTTNFHVRRELAWQTVLQRQLSTSPAAFSATAPEEPRYRAAFHAALTVAVVAQATRIAAAGDIGITDYDVMMKDALTRLISQADGFDNATIAALRVLRRRSPDGPSSLLCAP